jgi:ribosomal protein S12 methylthiotransferase
MKKEPQFSLTKDNSDNFNKIFIITLGCPKNVVDSEVLGGKLVAGGYRLVENIDIANTVIINTCGFILDSKAESLGMIGYAYELKKKKKINKLIVLGCLTQRYSGSVKQQFPLIDNIFGVNEPDNILKALNPVSKVYHEYQRQLLTPSHYAYLKISEGCNHQCSFCAIPNIRGEYISTPVEELVSEAEGLSKKGVKELLVIAQDTTYYGLDIYGERQLGTLLDKLSANSALSWIRLLYTHPSAFPEDVLKVIAERDNICKYIDIPLQHISDKILESMKRGTKSAYIEKLVDKIRSNIPGVAIRSTFIVGYPGETEKQFNELARFIEKSEFERVGVFKYSHEDDTPAWSLKDNVPDEVKEKRFAALMEIQQVISLKKNKALIGKDLKVLIDSEISNLQLTDSEYDRKIIKKLLRENENSNMFVGRTEHDAPEIDNSVLVFSDKKIEPGTFVNVRVEAASEYDLYGIDM